MSAALGDTARPDLGGKVVAVTGASRGLGLAFAQRLADAGASVLVNATSAEGARSASDAIVEGGGIAAPLAGSVADADFGNRLVTEAVARFGRIDALVANAGITRDRSLLKMSVDDFDEVVAVNLRGAFLCVQAVSRHFVETGSGGRVVCVGSPAGQRGHFGQTNYAAAKAGVVGMVRTWAAELERYGIRVNAIVPTAATSMTAGVGYLAAANEALERGEPMPDFFRREVGYGTPDDVSGLVQYLVSDESGDMTGQVIGIGGDRLQLWSHPEPLATLYRDGGWREPDIAEAIPALLDAHRQGFGDVFPALPAEFRG